MDCCRGMWRGVLLTSLGSIPSTERSSLTAADEESGYWTGAKEGSLSFLPHSPETTLLGWPWNQDLVGPAQKSGDGSRNFLNWDHG